MPLDLFAPQLVSSRRSFLKRTFAYSALASGVGRVARAATPPPAIDRNAHHAILFGDWGYDKHHEAQERVAAGMVRYVQDNRIAPEAVFMLGDSWYGPLPGGADDPRFQTHFEQMYPKSAFDCPVYSVMGNHDYQRMPGSKVEAELAYARRGTSRWTQPALWYTYDFPRHKPLMTVIALDSNMPGGHETNAVDFTLTPAQQAEQLAWLELELKKPRRTPFLIVFAHHPVYSNGPHGDHPILIRDWDPLFRAHKVDLYMAGHDHDLQHLELDGHPTSYVSSGAGGADLYTLAIPEAKRGPYAEKVYGFTHMELRKDRMLLRHLDEGGNVVHTFTRTAQGKVTIEG